MWSGTEMGNSVIFANMPYVFQIKTTLYTGFNPAKMPYVFQIKIYNVHTSYAIWTATLTKQFQNKTMSKLDWKKSYTDLLGSFATSVRYPSTEVLYICPYFSKLLALVASTGTCMKLNILQWQQERMVGTIWSSEYSLASEVPNNETNHKLQMKAKELIWKLQIVLWDVPCQFSWTNSPFITELHKTTIKHATAEFSLFFPHECWKDFFIPPVQDQMKNHIKSPAMI